MLGVYSDVWCELCIYLDIFKNDCQDASMLFIKTAQKEAGKWLSVKFLLCKHEDLKSDAQDRC